MKNSKESKKKNNKSGSSRITVEYEDEIAAIQSIDDSLQPEFVLGVGKEQRFKSQPTTGESRSANKKTVSDSLFEIFQQREAHKERRHRTA